MLWLYRKYCIQDGNLDACSVANIPRGILGTRKNLDTCEIHVDEQIRFEYGYVWKLLFGPETFFVVLLEALGIFFWKVLILTPIRSSPSLFEIRSTSHLSSL